MKSYHCNINSVCVIFVLSIVLFTANSCADNGKTGANTNIITEIFSKNIVDVKAVGKAVEMHLQTHKNGFVFDNDTIYTITEIEKIYSANNHETIWLSGNGLNKNAVSLLDNLEKLTEDGMNINKLHYAELTTMRKKIDAKNMEQDVAMKFDMGMTIASVQACDAMMNGQFEADSFNEDWYNNTDTQFEAHQYLSNMIAKDSIAYLFTNLRPTLTIYNKLINKLKELKTIQKTGGWALVNELKDSIANGLSNKNIAVLRTRLFKEIGIPKDTINTVMNDDVQTAIRSFQYLHDLRITGKLDTSTLRKLNMPVAKKIKIVQANLERLRWIQKDIVQPYVWVNIPKMELEYINADSTQFKMRTVVGRTSRPTPTLNAMMSNIVINPGWNVPPTIMKEEVVPGVGRRGGSYLAKRGLKAFYRGRQVSGDQINEKNYKAYVIQQKPGLNSALGAVKFNLPNRHAIYLHDTPHREDFVKYYRAYSSGCIRVEKPRDFAAFLLQDTNYTKLNIDTFIRKKITKEVPLKKKVEVHIVYVTNGLDSLGNVMYLRDIYNKDGKMYSLWE